MSKRRPKRAPVAEPEPADAKPTLLDVIDGMTKPRKVANWQGTALVRHTHVSLLEALRTAITSPDAIAGSGATSPQARSLLDIRALETLERIMSTTRSWVTQLDGTYLPDENAEALLRRFYRLLMEKPWAPTVADDYTGVLLSWESAIEEILDPATPVDFDEPTPCPRCGEVWVITGYVRLNGTVDPDDARLNRALRRFRRDTAERSYAECGACKARWKGVYAMRALSAELDDAEEAAKAAEQPTQNQETKA